MKSKKMEQILSDSYTYHCPDFIGIPESFILVFVSVNV